MLSTGMSGTEGLPAEQLSFAKFKDIPIPDGSVMDMNNTVIFGSDDEWFGRLSLIPNLSHADTFDFFRYEMPNLNWKEIAKKMLKPAWVFDSRSIVNTKEVRDSGLSLWRLGDGLGD